MTSPNSPTEDSPNRANKLLVQFLSVSHVDVDAELETLCAKHPGAASELRILYAASQDVEGRFAFFGSRSDEVESRIGDGARANDTIGDFELIRRIASGGQGEVWEAQQRSLNRRVALKLVLPERINSKSLTLFAREARAGGRLAHPGIVAVFGYGEDNGRHWIAQELVEGSWTLRDFIDEMRNAEELPRDYYRSVAGFLAALADALQAAHEAGVIHRDVKPQNVLVTKDDQPKLTDFGLARITDEAAVSVTGDFAGTWLYMSPEQVTAKRIELDHRTDVFSLGVVMYEMLALIRPFDGDTTHQIAEKILMWDPPDLTKIRSKVPKDLAVVCGKALEKRKDARYPTMTEFALDLRRWLSNESIHATPPSRIDCVAKWCKRNPTKSVAAALASVAIIAITLLLVENWRANSLLMQSISDLSAQTALSEARADELTNVNISLEKKTTEAKANADSALESALEANKNEERADGEARRALLARDETEKALQDALLQSYLANFRMAQFAQDGGNTADAKRWLAACPQEHRGWEWNFLSLLVDQSFISLTDANEYAFSKDGQLLVTRGNAGRIEVRDLNENSVVGAIPAFHSVGQSIAFNESGRSIVFEHDSHVQTWTMATGAREVVTFLDRASCVALDVGGTRIAYGSFGGLLEVRNAANGEVLWSETSDDNRFPKFSFACSPGGKYLAHMESEDDGGTILVRDAANGEIFATLLGGGDEISHVAISPNGIHVAGSDPTGSICIWDVAREEPLVQLDCDSAVSALAFSPNGLRVVAGSHSGTNRIWDVTTGALISETKGGYKQADAITFSPGGERIAVVSNRNTIRILNANSGKSIAKLEGHRRTVRAVAFSPDGGRIASISTDGFVGYWNAHTGELLSMLKEPFVVEEELIQFAERRPVPNSSRWSKKRYKIYETADDEVFATFTEAIPIKQGYAKGAISPDGNWTASVTRVRIPSDKDPSRFVSRTGVAVLNASTGERRAFLQEIKSSWTRMAFSANGRRLATSGKAGRSSHATITIYDASSGEELSTFEAHEGASELLVFDASGSRLASVSKVGVVGWWDSATGELLGHLGNPTGAVNDLSFSSDGAFIATASDTGLVHAWDAATGELRSTLAGHEEGAQTVAISSEGNLIASASKKALRVWDAATGELPITMDAGLSQEEREGFSKNGFGDQSILSKDGAIFASVFSGGRIAIWNFGSGKLLTILSDDSGSNWRIALNPDGSRLISSGFDGVKLWNVASGQVIGRFEGHSDSDNVFNIEVSPDGGRVVSGTTDGGVLVWDTETQEQISSHQVEGLVMGLYFSRDGERIVVEYLDEGRAVRILDADTGKQIADLEGHDKSITSVAISTDGKYIASGSWDKTVRLWDQRTGASLRVFPGHEGNVSRIEFDPDNARLASVSHEAIKLWDIGTGELLTSFERYSGSLNCISFSPDGDQIVSGNDDGYVTVWDSRTGEVLSRLKHDEDSVISTFFSPDGSRIVSSTGGAVRIWPSQVDDARRLWRTGVQALSFERLLQALIKEHVLLEPVLSALLEVSDLSSEELMVARQLARIRIPSVSTVNTLAWNVVDPDGDSDGDPAQALHFANATVSIAPDNSAYRDTLAWALFANERYEAAISESLKALELASEKRKALYRGYLKRMRQLVSDGKQDGN
jgi:WD40 repeat protein/serine/threonine protein kinase